MNADSIVLFACLVLIALLLHGLPFWRRSSLWFGVTVGPDFRDSPEGRRILRRYRTEMWTVSLAAAVLTWAGLRGDLRWFVAAAPLLQVLGGMAAFALGRNRARHFAQHPDGSRWASLSGIHEGMPGGPAALVVPYAILAGTAIFLRENWDRIPARFPVHWGISGTPDRWAERSWRSVDGPLLAGVAVVALMHVLGYMVLKGSPRARMAETAEWTRRFRRANLRMIVAMGCMISVLFAALTLNPYLANGDQLVIPVWLILGVVLALTAAFLWPIIRISQEPGSGSDGTPDECWKLGQIYYNPDDPALMVEKRFGVGYTINFGNRASWLLVAILLPAIFVPLLL
ncbi:MAG TPA: DUF5808 domain-containing protein [Bryobacteraceae bacterium]|nr:DUF5808 domain-containing protein [Bryobacteraceae bacterium]